MTGDSIKPEQRLEGITLVYRRKPGYWAGVRHGVLAGMIAMFLAFHLGVWIDGTHTFKDWKPLAYSAMFGWLKKLQ